MIISIYVLQDKITLPYFKELTKELLLTEYGILWNLRFWNFWKHVTLYATLYATLNATTTTATAKMAAQLGKLPRRAAIDCKKIVSPK